MTQVTEAIYEQGVLKPVKTLDLAERQRVRITIEPVPERDPAARAAVFKELVEDIRRTNFRYGGRLPTRDELHDRS